MSKVPRLGKLHGCPPKWWHQAEPASVTPESFQPAPPPSREADEASRFNKLADIALHERRLRKRKTHAA